MTDTLEFPKLPKWHRWRVRYSPILGMPRLHVKIVWLGLFTVEDRTGTFDTYDSEITPERVRDFAIRLARSTYATFLRNRKVDELRAAASAVELALNSGDPKKVGEE